MKKNTLIWGLGIMLSLFVNCLQAKERIALIIGNSDYQIKPLNNPVNDARLIASTLKQLDFEVLYLENANHEQMENAVMAFANKLHKNSIGLFYFSGHGVQHNGSNFLIPINAMSQVNNANQLKHKTINASYVIEAMEASGSGLNLFFLDACRNTPFKSFSRSTDRGLAKISGAEGTLIAYATAPEKVALDGIGKNSPYTWSLVNYMSKPKLPVELMLKKVRSQVKADTKGKQSPWYEASIDGDFYFNPDGRVINIPTTPPKVTISDLSTQHTEVITDNKPPKDIITEPKKEQETSACSNNFNGANISGSSIGNINIDCN